MANLLEAVQQIANAQELSGWVGVNFDELSLDDFATVRGFIEQRPTVSNAEMLQRLEIAQFTFQLLHQHSAYRGELLQALTAVRSKLSPRSFFVLQQLLSVPPLEMPIPLDEFFPLMDERFWQDSQYLIQYCVELDHTQALANHLFWLTTMWRQTHDNPSYPHQRLINKALTAHLQAEDPGYYIQQFTPDTLSQLDRYIETTERIATGGSGQELDGTLDALREVKELAQQHFTLQAALTRPAEEEILSVETGLMVWTLNWMRSSAASFFEQLAANYAMAGLDREAADLQMLAQGAPETELAQLDVDTILAATLAWAAATEDEDLFNLWVIEELTVKRGPQERQKVKAKLIDHFAVFEQAAAGEVIWQEIERDLAIKWLVYVVTRRDDWISAFEFLKIWQAKNHYPVEELAVSLLNYADSYIAGKLYGRAEKIVTLALALVADCPLSFEVASILLLAGQTYLQLGLAHRALDCLNRITLASWDVRASLNYQQLSDTERAELTGLEEMVTQMPIQWYLARSITHFSLGQFEVAEQALRQAIVALERVQFATDQEQLATLQFLTSMLQISYWHMGRYGDALTLEVEADVPQGTLPEAAIERLFDNYAVQTTSFEEQPADEDDAELAGLGRVLRLSTALMWGEYTKAMSLAFIIITKARSFDDLTIALLGSVSAQAELGKTFSVLSAVENTLAIIGQSKQYFSREEVFEVTQRLFPEELGQFEQLPVYIARTDFQRLAAQLLSPENAQRLLTLLGERNPLMVARLLAIRGRVLVRQGDYVAALNSLREAGQSFQLTQAHQEHLSVLELLGQLGHWLRQTDLWQEAANQIDNLLSVEGAHQGIAELLHTAAVGLRIPLSRNWREHRDYAESLKKSANLFDRGNMKGALLKQYVVIGQAYLTAAWLNRQHEQTEWPALLDQAAHFWMRALYLMDNGLDLPTNFMAAVSGLGRLSMGLNSVEASGSIMLALVSPPLIFELPADVLDRGDSPHLLRIVSTWGLLGLGIFLTRQAKAENLPISKWSVDSLLQALLKAAEKDLLHAPHEQWQFSLAQARVLDLLGYETAAFECYQKTATIVEDIRHRLPDYALRIGYGANLDEVLREQVALTVRLPGYQTSATLELVERARSRAFLDLLENRTFASANSTSAGKALRTEMLQQEIVEALAASNHVVTPEIRLLQLELDEAWREVRDAYPLYYDLWQAPPVTFAEIQKLIKLPA